MLNSKLSTSEESILINRGYKFLSKLGEGTYAKVLLAEYKPKDRSQTYKLACKVIDTEKAPQDFVKKFLPRELEILAKLNHPNVVQVHSIFQKRGKYFIFMRFAENGDLLEFLLKNGAVTENEARVWFRQLSLGLHYLHDLNIAHRDMKCENILLTLNNNLKIADFGFARYVVDKRGKKVMSDTYCGSLSYVAPEILRLTPYEPKIADIWSLGVILYILLNKTMPFDETNVIPVLSETVKNLVSLLLEPDTAKRPKIEEVIETEWLTMGSQPPISDLVNETDSDERNETSGSVL